MRTALTLGFKEDGSATIISGPEVAIDEQQRAFTELSGAEDSDYVEIQLWESDGGVRRSQRFGEKGIVNFNAAHPVEKQQAGNGKGKKLPDLTPAASGGTGVDFNAAHPVEQQQDAKAAKNLPDLNALREQGVTGKAAGVNWGAVTPVEEQSGATTDGDDLENFTVDQLKDIAGKEHADLTGLTLKADIITAIELNRTPVEDRTIAQLQDLAARENIDLTGKSVKADIIAAILEARSARGSDSDPTL